jgi:hypothetical protein
MIGAGFVFVIVGKWLEDSTVDRFDLYWFGCITGMVFAFIYMMLFMDIGGAE